jgi:hypothetical protein
LNETHLLLFFADSVILLGQNKNRPGVKEKENKVLDVSKGTDQEMNTGKSKGMFMSRNWNTGQNHNIEVVNKSLKILSEFTYLGTKS